jgi:urease accessory protein
MKDEGGRMTLARCAIPVSPDLSSPSVESLGHRSGVSERSGPFGHAERGVGLRQLNLNLDSTRSAATRATGGRIPQASGPLLRPSTRIPHFSSLILRAVAAALAALPAAAWAHHFMGDALPQTFMQGLLSGLGHPLIGPDHAAFIIASGFFLALVDRGMWGVLALIGGTLAGAALHLLDFDMPGGEVGVALSVIVIGALVMARRKIELTWLVAGLAVAGVLHGHAYAESIFGAEPAPLGAYLLGFSAIQFAVAAAAFRAHRRIIADRESWAKPVAVGLGGVVGAVGIAFLVLNIG